MIREDKERIISKILAVERKCFRMFDSGNKSSHRSMLNAQAIQLKKHGLSKLIEILNEKRDVLKSGKSGITREVGK